MARVRYSDFRQSDSTKLFNERFRGILLAGVYSGYNVASATLGGLTLKLTHDTHPDVSGGVLGKLLTHSGLIIEEDANQDNAIVGSVSAGTPNIHYVVASYQYNQSLPNNDVVYAVLQGTSGAVPTPPTLTDSQILLAKIFVPSGAASYTATGVTISNVAKLDLYSTDTDLVTRNLTGVIKPGIYDGMSMIRGSTDLRITLNAGTWVTKENFQVDQAAAQADLLLMTDPGVDQYAWCWLIAGHKFEETDPYPSANYILVQGTAAANGASAAFPTDTQIRTALATAHPKYDTNGDGLAETSYFNKLGLVRLQKSSTSVITVEYIRGESLLDDSTLIVSGATSSSEYRSSAYFGGEGFERALTRAKELSVLSEGKVQIPIGIDGIVKLRDVTHRVPSNVRLFGLDQQSKLISNVAKPLEVEGLALVYNGVNNLITNPATVGSYTPPSGYVSRVFAFDSVNYTASLANLSDKKFCRGDRIIIQDNSSSVKYEAIFVAQTATYSVDLFVVTQYQTDGNPADLNIQFIKSRVTLERLTIESDVAGDGKLSVKGVENCNFDNLKLGSLDIDDQRDCTYGTIETTDITWSSGAYSFIGNTRNRIDHLRILYATSGTKIIGTSATNIVIGIIERIAAVTVNAALSVQFTNSEIGVVRTVGSASSTVSVATGSGMKIGAIEASGSILFSGSGNVVEKAITDSAGTLDFVSGTRNIIYRAIVGSGGVVYTTVDNVVFSCNNASDKSQVGEHHNEDRNLRVVSDASITWTLGTTTLLWNAVLRFDIPWQTGYTQIAAGSISLPLDGDRAYIDIDRDATATTVVVPTVRSKVNAALDRFSQNRIYLAVRHGSVIYMCDGTRIEDGQSIKFGSTPPPDGSVTYGKLGSALTGTPTPATDPLAFLNKYFRDYCVAEDNVGWDSEFYFINTTAATYTYSATTGVIQYGSAVDLAAAQAAFDAGVPMWFMFQNVNYAGGGQRCLRKEQILAIDDSLNRVTIMQGTSVTIGAGHRWNGAIGRGPILVSNTALTTFTYTAEGSNVGRITFTNPVGFSQYQVLPGHVFVDSGGNKFVIYDTDLTGAGAWIRIQAGLRDVDVTAPTSVLQGRIEENNNPFNLNLADCRVLAGSEFIPVDLPGEEAGGNRTSTLIKPGSISMPFDTTKSYQRKFTIPYDERITCLTIQNDWQALGSMPGTFTGQAQLEYGSNNMVVLEVTAVCTGMILITNGQGDNGYQGQVTVDGVDANFVWNYTQDDISNLYGWSQNRYSPVLDALVDNYPNIGRVHQGIHTFRFSFTNANSIRAVKGIVILNEVPTSNVANTVYITDSPGTLVHKGGVRKYTLPKARVAVPTNPYAAFDKGGRHLRYVAKDGSRNWVSRYVRSFASTANVANGSADITGVSGITNWRVGDLVFIRSNIGNPHNAQILSISGTTITTGTVWSGTSQAVTIHYLGKGPKSLNYASTNLMVVRSHFRQEEEIAMHIPTINEFAGGGTYEDTRSFHGIEGSLSTLERTVRLSDGFTFLVASENATYLDSGRISIGTLGHKIRIGFVGTGLSIDGTFNTDTILHIDGINCGVMWNPGATGEHPQDDGFFICGELPYGSHVVELERGATNNVTLRGFTVYQPKKPVIATSDSPSVELWDSNYLGHCEFSLPVGIMNEASYINRAILGMINMGCYETFNHRGDNNIVQDAFVVMADNKGGGVINTNGGANTSDSNVLFMVDGDHVQMQFSFIVLAAGTMDVYFMGEEGVFRSPSTMSVATGGFEVYGADTIATNAVPSVSTWQFSKRVKTAILFQWSDDSAYVEFASYNIHPKWHTYKSKLPATIDHWLPYQYGGKDIRPTTPFSHDSSESAKPHVQVAVINWAGTLTDEDSRTPFTFYSKGGYGRVSCTALANNTASASFYVDFYIDGVSILFNGKEHQANASGQDIGVSLERVMYFSPGFHTVSLLSENTFDTTFSKQVWSFENFGTATNQLPSNSDGAPVNGPAGPNNQSY